MMTKNKTDWDDMDFELDIEKPKPTETTNWDDMDFGETVEETKKPEDDIIGEEISPQAFGF